LPYFRAIAALANGAIEGVPEMFCQVEISLPFCKNPKQVEILFEHWKGLLAKMKNMISRARKE